MPTLAIQAKPHWPIPSAARLQRAPAPPRMLKQFENWHEGLDEIRIHVNARKTATGLERGPEIQRLYLEARRKKLSPESLCRLTWLRAERNVRQHQKSTQFRVHLLGILEGKPFDHQLRFTIKPHEIIEDSLADDEEGDSADEDGEEEEEGEEEEDEEGEEDEEEIDEAYDGRSDLEEEEADWNEGPSALVPVQVEHVELATGERHLVPQQLNPAFITHLQKSTLGMAHRAYSGPMRENRMLVHEMRQEMSAVIRDVKGMADMLLRQSLNIHKESSERSNKLIEYLTDRLKAADHERVENSKLTTQHYENLQQLAKQGWLALQDGARMKQEAIDDRVAWIKWREDQAEFAPSLPAPVGESGGPTIIEQASNSPLLLGGLSMLARKMGNEQGAVFLENLAKRVASRDDQEDDEEDGDGDGDGDGDYHDVEAHDTPPGNGHAQPFVGQPAGPSAPPRTPFVDRVRAFRHSLSPESLAAMQKILPKPAWRAFESACGAGDDPTAAAAIKTMHGFLEKQVTVTMQLGEHLTEDQITEIFAVVEEVKKVGVGTSRRAAPRRPPPRPEPSSPAE